jgi:AcrR family transcriptional regulator
MIAQKAGRPLSLLSHYFGNKEGLYLEVFRYTLETSGFHPPGLETGPDLVPQDRPGAIRLLREQIHFMFHQASPDAAAANPFLEQSAKLWTQEFQSPRPSLHPLINQYLSPATEAIRGCIHILRPDLNEAQVAFLGKTIMGQVAGHGALSGLNNLLWGEHPASGSHFQQAELLVDFCLYGLRIGSPGE